MGNCTPLRLEMSHSVESDHETFLVTAASGYYSPGLTQYLCDYLGFIDTFWSLVWIDQMNFNAKGATVDKHLSIGKIPSKTGRASHLLSGNNLNRADHIEE